MKKKQLISLCLLICCVALLGANSQAVRTTPKLASESACVIDADTGEILYQKHANRALRPASITKQMTALLVLEHVDQDDNASLDDKVKVTNQALSTVDLNSTWIGFEAGQRRTVRDLMYCMLVYSANDAANILAEYVAGDVDDFVDCMNQKAKELGCTNTHFDNPNGLDPDDPNGDHHTTAHDMALISYALEQYPDYFDFAGSMNYDLDTDKVMKESWQIWTKVDMLLPDSPYYNSEVIAGKTGWTSKAHHTFVVYMTRDDRNLIIVTMNSLAPGDKYTDAEALMDYCCDQYDALTLTPDTYQSAAETCLHQIDSSYQLDTSALPDISLLLPNGLNSEDLRYKVELTNEDQATLIVGIAESGWDTYKEATHMSGENAELVHCTLPLKHGLSFSSQRTAEDAGSGSAGSAAWGFPSSSDRTRLIITIGAAALVVLSLLFLILRTARRRSSKRAAQQNDSPSLEIIIKTPEQYRTDDDKTSTD